MGQIRDLQKRAYQNKVNHHFNTTNVEKEFCYLYGEVGEAFDAYRKKKSDFGEELADIMIFTLGIAEILGYDLEKEVLHKMVKNEKRVYHEVDGVLLKVSE